MYHKGKDVDAMIRATLADFQQTLDHELLYLQEESGVEDIRAAIDEMYDSRTWGKFKNVKIERIYSLSAKGMKVEAIAKTLLIPQNVFTWMLNTDPRVRLANDLGQAMNREIVQTALANTALNGDSSLIKLLAQELGYQEKTVHEVKQIDPGRLPPLERRVAALLREPGEDEPSGEGDMAGVGAQRPLLPDVRHLNGDGLSGKVAGSEGGVLLEASEDGSGTS